MITIKTFEVNYFSENTYVISDETNEAVLIDCGCLRPQEQQELSDYITEKGLTLTHYLCTHLHLDHTFGNEYVFNTYNLQPEASQADVDGIPTAEQQARAFGLNKAIKTIPLGRELIDGDEVYFGHSKLKVLATPGHTPGGLSFYNEAEGFVLVGDSLFAGSIGRTDLWGGSADSLLASINEKLMTLPDDTIIYPGHGPATRVDTEKKNNPYI